MFVRSADLYLLGAFITAAIHRFGRTNQDMAKDLFSVVVQWRLGLEIVFFWGMLVFTGDHYTVDRDFGYDRGINYVACTEEEQLSAMNRYTGGADCDIHEDF